jgi:hypothetical protein
MMFALALGIDYALFIVVRFRAALHRRADEPDRAKASIDAIAETMGTAGKAVAFSGLTVLVSLTTVLLVPSPAFRSMALGSCCRSAPCLPRLSLCCRRYSTSSDGGRARHPVDPHPVRLRGADSVGPGP